MTNGVEPSLRELFSHLADHTTVSADPQPAAPPAVRSRRPWSYFVAAAATVVLVAGVVVVQVNRDTPASTPVDDGPVGLFPAGDVERVVAFGYSSPTDVAISYVADRLDADAGAVTDVSASTATPRMIDDDRALVQFQLWRDGAPIGGVGELVAERVIDAAGASGWTVTAAMLRLGDLSRLSFSDGTIHGEFASSGEGPRLITVHDARTGEQLKSVELDGSREEFTDAWGDSKLVDQFEITGVDAEAVSVRAWNPAGSASPDAPGEFAEVLVRTGESTDRGLEESFHQLGAETEPGPFAHDGASVLDRLDDREPLVVIDNDEVTISVRAQGADRFCIGVILAAETDLQRNRDCQVSMPRPAPPLFAVGSFLGTGFGGGPILVGIVPDSVASITDASGRPVTLADNVWYDVISNTPHAYLFSNADGSETQVVRYGSLMVSLGGLP